MPPKAPTTAKNATVDWVSLVIAELGKPGECMCRRALCVHVLCPEPNFVRAESPLAKAIEDKISTSSKTHASELKDAIEKMNARMTRKFKEVSDVQKKDADDLENDLKDCFKRVDEHDTFIASVRSGKRKQMNDDDSDLTPKKRSRTNEQLIRSIKE